jgi:hypothetical protein
MITRPNTHNTGVQGAAKFAARLQALEGELRVAVQAAIRDETEDVAAEMRTTVPVRSGLLQKSISIEVTPDGMTGFAKAGGRKAPHAHLVEFGHAKVGGGTVAGKPFVTPAGERGRVRLNARLAELLKEATQ